MFRARRVRGRHRVALASGVALGLLAASLVFAPPASAHYDEWDAQVNANLTGIGLCGFYAIHGNYGAAFSSIRKPNTSCSSVGNSVRGYNANMGESYGGWVSGSTLNFWYQSTAASGYVLGHSHWQECYFGSCPLHHINPRYL